MLYFSGFGLQNERVLFEDLLRGGGGPRTFAGFSLGAVQAFECALGGIGSSGTNRSCTETGGVRDLDLISPAFFMDKSTEFKRDEILRFERSHAGYMRAFYGKLGIKDRTMQKMPAVQDLKLLLHYKWRAGDFAALKGRGVRIRVFLGGADGIMNARAALEFFKPLCTVYFFKGKGHILR
ncbi:MAG: hypothetical protein ACTTIC_07475 [Helicobacteraceae bacterium]